MSSGRMTILLVVAVVMAAGVSFGQVHFNDGKTWEIGYEINDSVHADEGAEYAEAKTMVDIVENGSVPWPHSFRAYNQSTAVVSGGSVSTLKAYDTSTVDISGGSVHFLQAYDKACLKLSSGNVAVIESYDTTRVEIIGGTFNKLSIYDNSTATLSGGGLSDWLNVWNKSNLNIIGGSIGGRGLRVWNTANVNIYGGNVWTVHAFQSATITFWATDFFLGEGLSLNGNELVGIGLLSGQWLDGTEWTTEIRWNDDTATILLIPEPATLLLLSLGGLALPYRKRQ